MRVNRMVGCRSRPPLFQKHNRAQMAGRALCAGGTNIGFTCCDRRREDYVANAGDSRVVLGLAVKATGEAIAIQFLTKHSAYIESVREELRSLHLYDHYIVVLKDNVWHVKCLNQGHVVWMMTSTRINNRNG
ncbi:probable protein phosphatase 2C 60 [Helianthus annuus]|uniref:probable protein phosphatase 2C 60 n=1 Tax=Helianthus annuus TaxID=4232 RepID=UPI001652C518|nr:probable protein phosphatase 2C 60 [Helianthus annuus]XP_035834852.1 probable protein phosphatase 2C 60 [Helianthus annuus]